MVYRSQADQPDSEEAENATELTADVTGQRAGPDALGVQGNQIRRYIHSFDDAYVYFSILSYILLTSHTVVASMWLTSASLSNRLHQRLIRVSLRHPCGHL